MTLLEMRPHSPKGINVEVMLTAADPSLERVAMAAIRLAVGGELMIGSSSGTVFRVATAQSVAAVAVIKAAPSLLDSASREVKAFVGSRNLKSEIGRTIRLIYDYFPPGIVISLDVETDPEAEEECLVVDVKTWGGADVALRAYNGFVKEWVVAVPPAVRDAVRVTFNLSESWSPICT